MTALAFFLGVVAGGTVGAIGTALAIAGTEEPVGRIIEPDEDTDRATGHAECGRCHRIIEPFDTYCRHCGARL